MTCGGWPPTQPQRVQLGPGRAPGFGVNGGWRWLPVRGEDGVRIAPACAELGVGVHGRGGQAGYRMDGAVFGVHGDVVPLRHGQTPPGQNATSPNSATTSAT